ncbi:MAG: 30S ribosomal protein S9 [bacterium]|nr:30S ribosomal protein S9 [bacterium]
MVTKKATETTKVAKTTKEEASPKPSASKERYFYARGARKTAVARVKLFVKNGGVTINGKDIKTYFPVPNHQHIIAEPLKVVGKEMGIIATVKGGGVNAQAEAIRHGVSRALVKLDETLKKRLRKEGFITRDSRMVERKKYGLKKARRAPQWAKR